MRRLIIFGCDGVLRHYPSKFHFNGFCLSTKGTAKRVNIGPDKLFNLLRNDSREIEGVDNNEIKELKGAFIREYLSRTRLFPWVKDMLELLSSKRFVIAVCSNNFGGTLYKSFPEVDGISYILGREGVKNPKPHPEGILKLMGILSTRPTNTIMIGSSPVDVDAGRRAGVKTALVTWGGGYSEKEAGEINSHLVINSPDELCPELLLRVI